MSTFIGIRWIVDLSLWNRISPDWVQAVGSILAIIGSFALAQYQARGAERQRRADRFDRDTDQAVICLWLAKDALACLGGIEVRINSRIGVVASQPIGTERLIQIQQTLITFASRDIHPALMREMTVLQREVAYTLTAILEIGNGPASVSRHANAEKRSAKVLDCKRRLQKTVIAFRKQAGAAKRADA